MTQAWIDHLLEGGTTPWSAWDGPAGDPPLPGAQHLELARRLNLVGGSTPALVGRVLATSAPGRGSQELPVAGAVPSRGFGPRPVDPADVPSAELVRLASGVVADLAVARHPSPMPPFPAARRKLLRTRYELAGNPLVAVRVARELRAVGRPPGGRRARVLVVVGDFDDYLVDAWTARVRRGIAPPWSAWLDHLAKSRGLPERIDPVAHARAAAKEHGARRVLVVTDAAELPRLLGVPHVPMPAAVSHATLDAIRHTKGVLRVLLTEDQRELMVRQVLFPWFEAADGGPDRAGARPAVPSRHRAWATAQATRVRDRLTEAGYAVHGGGLDRVVPVVQSETTPERPPETEVLDVMLRVISAQGGAV